MLFLQVAAQPSIDMSVVALGISVVAALTGTIGVLFKLLLTSKDREISGKDEATKSILAERANAAPLLEKFSALTDAVNNSATVMREVRDTNVRIIASLDRNTERIDRLLERRSTSASSQSTRAVSP